MTPDAADRLVSLARSRPRLLTHRTGLDPEEYKATIDDRSVIESRVADRRLAGLDPEEYVSTVSDRRVVEPDRGEERERLGVARVPSPARPGVTAIAPSPLIPSTNPSRPVLAAPLGEPVAPTARERPRQSVSAHGV